MVSILDNKTRLGSLVLLLFASAYLKVSLTVPIDTTFGDEVFTSRTLPLVLSITTIFCALIQLLALPGSPANLESFSSELKGSNWRHVLGLLILMLVYSLSFQWLGFLLGGISFLFAGFMLLGERRYWLAGIVSVGLAGGLWMALTQLFGLYLDSGELVRALMGTET